MTPERARELLPVITAFADGKAIEAKYYTEGDDRWSPSEDPKWSDVCEYRIKPERRKVWVHFKGAATELGLNAPEPGVCEAVGCKVVCVEEPE